MTVRGAIRVAVAALLCALALPGTAVAADYVVNTTADSSVGPCDASHCSLREAVNAATTTADRVIVPAGLYQLQTQGELLLANDTLVGAGARDTSIRGNGTGRVMTVNGGTVSGVTISNGGGAGQSQSGSGGGVLVNGSATLTGVHVTGNRATFGGGGIYLDNAILTIANSTVAGNVALDPESQGGGIATGSETDLDVINSTVSGNSVGGASPNGATGGGIHTNGYTLDLFNTTVAGNIAPALSGGGIRLNSGDLLLVNSVLADNTGGACSGAAEPASHHNLATDGTCGLTGPGNLQGITAGLGALANNGGQTDTRALLAGSPAINAGSGCEAADQRGVARPQHGACDIGAFEYRAAVLTVTTAVTNDQGGTAEPAEFAVRVRANGADVAGSPAPGSSGTSYTVPPGTYLVSADALRGYTFATGAACAADGTVTLAEGQSAACTLLANDPSPPRNGANAAPVRGTVRIKEPGKRFRVLREGEPIPNGTIVDTLKGRVKLFAASNGSGGTKSADFYDGIFRVNQGKGRRPITTLTLTEKLTCPKAGNAVAAAKKKKRRLWGDGSGRFRTKGKHSAATVVGTKWLVEDRCTSTLTRVVRGKVSVRDFAKRKTVTVRKGKRYVARAR